MLYTNCNNTYLRIEFKKYTTHLCNNTTCALS